ncbi:3-deoxy-D-manno-octulosonic acid transferase [Coxiella endosymbiont of Amblyomma americanum]|nr:3-deoxy-D-manno-octulosonic acid transferase [Coxiella endosymbiont of Amblyomma americanum]
MIRYLYILLSYILSPFIFFRTLCQLYKKENYRHRFLERFGYINTIDIKKKSLWIHAVSLGEAITAVPLISALLKSYPQHTLIITTTTVTGSEQIRKNFGDQIYHVYCPYDFPGSANRFLQRIHPQLAIIMETELWPNILYYLYRQNIPILLANARLSKRSMHNYLRVRPITQKMLSQITCVAAQSDIDGKRFLQLGLPNNRLFIAGNMKFDLQISKYLIEKGKNLRKNWGLLHPTLIAASTHEGEEIIILKVFQELRRQFQHAHLILVPRHPNRFNKVAYLCKSIGFSVAKRSLHKMPSLKNDILLGDVVGELRWLYAASDVAFIGGSLVPAGGHNLIEPAAMHLPIISGPNLQNFLLVSKLLKTAHALIIISDSTSLLKNVVQLFNNPKKRKQLGELAYQVSITNKGALNRHLQWIHKQITGNMYKQRKLI